MSIKLYPVKFRARTVAYTMVDSDIAEALAGRRVNRNPGTGYAWARVEGRSEYLHRIVLGLRFGDGLVADHINHNRLDNRRANLRAVTVAENNFNRSAASTGSSQYRGVYWSWSIHRWVARAGARGIQVHLGTFKDEDEAGAAVLEFWASVPSQTPRQAGAQVTAPLAGTAR